MSNNPSTVSEPMVSVMVLVRIAEFLTDLKPDDADFIHMILSDDVFKPLTDLLGRPSVLENKVNFDEMLFRYLSSKNPYDNFSPEVDLLYMVASLLNSCIVYKMGGQHE